MRPYGGEARIPDGAAPSRRPLGNSTARKPGGVRVRLARGVRTIEFEGHLILTHEDRQLIAVLNETGRIAWDVMQAGISARDVALLLAQGYGMPLARPRADLAAALRLWRAQALLGGIAGPAEQASGVHPTPFTDAPARPQAPARFCVEGVYRFCGVNFRLRFEQEEVSATMHQLLAHVATARKAVRHRLDLIQEDNQHVLIHNGWELARSPAADRAAGRLVRTLCDLSYPDAEWLTFLHAAAVGYGDRAVVLAAPMAAARARSPPPWCTMV